jgi:hypothetical protein
MGVVTAWDRNKNKSHVRIKCAFKDVTQEMSGRCTDCIHLQSRKYAGRFLRNVETRISITIQIHIRMKVFENRVLRRVFGPMRDEVTGEWRKLHNDELNDLYSLPNRVLRGVFGPKRDEVTGEWRKLHNEELNDLYYLPNRVLRGVFGPKWDEVTGEWRKLHNE